MADSRKDWRRGAKGERRTGTTAGAGVGRGWQSRKKDAGQSAKFRHRTRLLGIGLAAVGLLAAFVIAVLLIPKRTPLIVVGVKTYAAPVPPNGYVQEDVEQLGTVNPTNLLSRDPVFQDFDRAAFRRHLSDQLQASGIWIDERVILVYVSAHGVVDSQGKACLLLSDSDPLDETTWLPLSDILDLLAARQGPTKVLLLDSGKIDANWSFGILHDNFAERAAEEVQQRTNIFILTAASAGELAWTAPELNGSVFAHFVGRGLQGAADCNGDRRVSLTEFHRYVRNHVDRWARDNRASRQTPKLSPDPSAEQDIKLAYVAGSELPARESESASRIADLATEWRTKMKSRWELYQKLITEKPVERHNPLGLAELQQRLLRLEQLLLAGGAYREEYSDELTKVDLLLGEQSQPRLPGALRGFALPWALSIEESVEPPAERDAVLASWLQADGWPTKDGKETPIKLSYLGAADVAWRWLLQRDAEPDVPQMQVALRLIRSSGVHKDDRNKPIADVLEAHWLEMALRHLDRPAPEAGLELNTRTLLRQVWLAQQAVEEAAAPLDERVHYWTQPLVNAADSQRRLAVDQLFVGDAMSSAASAATLQTLNGSRETAGSYAEALARGKELADYYALRDRVWARLPYLTMWFAEYLLLDYPRIKLRDSGAMQADIELAIRNLHVLADELDAAPPTGGLTPSERLTASFTELRDSMSRLQKDHDSFVTELLAATADSHALREAHLALRSPLTLTSDREKLFIDKYLEAMFGSQPVTVQNPCDPGTAEDAVVRPAIWATHPAVLFLQRNPDPRPDDITDLAWFDQQGGQVRQLLSGLEDSVRNAEHESEDLLRSEATDATDRRTRQGLSQADQRVRAAAVLLGRRPWPELEDDPSYKLRLVDTHFYLLWHDYRALEDFWGPTHANEGRPFFAEVADKYLQLAKSLAPQAAVLRYAGQDLANLRTDRLRATEVTLEAGEIVSYGNTPPQVHQITLNWQADLLPRGLAAVYVTSAAGDDARNALNLLPVIDEQSKETVRRRGQHTQAAGPVFVRQRLSLDEPEGASQQPLEARLYYRGHVASDRFFVRRPKFELVTSLTPSRPDTASVTVSGEGNARGNIMFIVDCSGTMSENNRMPDARNALQEVLDLLSRQSNFNVGLRAYGRRSGFAKGPDGRAIPDGLGGYKLVPAESNLHPDEDADDVLAELGRLTPERLDDDGDINLSKLQPRGLTPIYRALQTSLENDFAGTPRDASRSIILITDGLNDQSGLQALGRKVRPTTANDVLTTWLEQGRDTQIYIVLIKRESSVTELQQLSTDTGGRFYDRPDAQQLAEDLRDALGLVRFSVTDPLQREVPRDEQKELGELITIPGFTDSPRPFVIRLHGIERPPSLPITLDGGEALRLNFYRGTNQLLFPDFPDREPFTAVGTPQSKLHQQHKYVIKAHRPDVKQSHVDFYLSVQNETNAVDDMFENFTPRLGQMWCEITPVSGARSLDEQRFHFFDLDYMPHQPLPMLRFRAQGWPRDVTQADLQLWFTWERPDLQQLQGEELDASGAPIEFAQVAGLSGVHFEASGGQSDDMKGYRVAIQEQHDDRQSPLDTTFLLLDPAPQNITHTYFHGIGAALHQYEYATRQAVTAYIVPSAEFKARAIEVRPIRVDVVK